MCFSSGDGGSAAYAREQDAKMQADEEKRQADIKTGQGKIDTAFNQFDTPYYDKFKSTYTGYYNPQIADQYAEARGKLTAALAGRGTLESTIGANALGRVDKQKADAEAQIGNQSADAAAGLRGQVENTKTNLYNINRAAADPEGISARATGEATALVAPQAFSPLGQVFANAVQPFLAFNKVDSTSMNPRLPWNSYSPPLSGRGSGFTV